MTQVGAVVLNWNNYGETSRCVSTLRKASSKVRIKIWIVDNGSSDGSAERLAAQFPDSPLVCNGRNLGFACGVNEGLKAAMADGCGCFLLINNDAEVADGFLDRAAEILESDAGVGVVTGKILARSPPGLILHAGGRIDSVSVLGVERGNGEMDSGQYETECDTGWAAGTLCLIARRTIDRIGFLPDAYFFGHEEYEYSTRVLRSGLRIVYCPQMKCVHADGSSHSPGHPVLMVYNHVLSKFIYARRNLSPWSRFRLSACYAAYLVLIWPWSPSRARRGCRTWRDYRCRFKAAWLAFLDRNRYERTTLEVLASAQARIGTSESWGNTWARP